MEKKVRISATALIQVIVNALFLAGLLTVLRSCDAAEDGTWMHCHSAWVTVLVLAAAMLALSVLKLFDKNPRVGLAFDIVTVPLAVITALTPGTIIGMCMMNTMRCRSVMRPGVLVFCVLAALAAAADGLAQRGAIKKKDNT